MNVSAASHLYHLTSRCDGRVQDKVRSSCIVARAAQLNR
jgi:hypothetical protein